jgi:hypothetical protein
MTKEPVSFVRGEVYRSSDKKTSKFKFIAQLDVNAVTIPEIDMVVALSSDVLIYATM